MDAINIIDSFDRIYKFIRLPGEERSEFCFGITGDIEKTKKRLQINNIFEQDCGTDDMARFISAKLKEFGFLLDPADEKTIKKGKTIYGYLYKKSEKEKKEEPVKKSAIELISEERERQITKEGFGPEHDDMWADGELALAAASYAMTPDARKDYSRTLNEGEPTTWPFDSKWWKPTPKDRIRELTKAGALIVAEIERLRRNG